MNQLQSVLKETLDRAVEQAGPLDHALLQHRGRRQHRLRVLSATVGVMAVLAGLTSAGLALGRGPQSVDVANEPKASMVTETMPAEGSSAPTESFQDWYERERGLLADALHEATPEQQEALSDGVVTAAEFEAARSSFAECMREAGHDISLQPGGYEITAGVRKPSQSRQEQLDQDDARCTDTHLNVISAAWEWQKMDHQAEGAHGQRELTGTPPSRGTAEPATEFPMPSLDQSDNG